VIRRAPPVACFLDTTPCDAGRDAGPAIRGTPPAPAVWGDHLGAALRPARL